MVLLNLSNYFLVVFLSFDEDMGRWRDARNGVKWCKINRNRHEKDIYKKMRSCKANRLKKTEWLQRNGNVWKWPTKWPTCSQKTCKTNKRRNKTALKRYNMISWATKCPNWDLKPSNLYLRLHKFKKNFSKSEKKHLG